MQVYHNTAADNSNEAHGYSEQIQQEQITLLLV